MSWSIHQVWWPRGLEAQALTDFLAATAAALTKPRQGLWRTYVSFEAVAHKGRIRHYMIYPSGFTELTSNLHAHIPGARHAEIQGLTPTVGVAAELALTTARRPLRVDRQVAINRAILTALSEVQGSETIWIQHLFAGVRSQKPPRLLSRSRPDHRLSAPVLAEFDAIADPGRLDFFDSESVRQARLKQAEPQFASVIRVGVTAKSRERRHQLGRAVISAMRGVEAPGVRFRRRGPGPQRVGRRLRERKAPLDWGMLLGASEAASILAVPLETPSVVGLQMAASRQLPPPVNLSQDETKGVVFADSTFPGHERPLILLDKDRTTHSHIVGPSGSGKSWLVASQAIHDIHRGLGIVSVDAKGDTNRDIADAVPPWRIKDVIWIDPTDVDYPVGLNPLLADERSIDAVVEHLLAVFAGVYRVYFGPRTSDLMRAGIHLLALASTAGEQFTLCELPAAFTNFTFLRRLLARIDEPLVLEPFFIEWMSLTPGQRAERMASMMNKLNALIGRRPIRNTVGQPNPQWSMENAIATGKIVLVTLPGDSAEVGQLLGALVVSRLYQAILGRAAIAPEDRPAIHIYLDEFQSLVHLPVALDDLLAKARGWNVSLCLSHQHMSQLNSELISGVLSNAKSRCVFRTGVEDSRLLAKGMYPMKPDDLAGLGAYEVAVQLAANGATLPVATGRTRPLGPSLGSEAAVRAASRRQFGTKADKVEGRLRKRLGVSPASPIDRQGPIGIVTAPAGENDPPAEPNQ